MADKDNQATSSEYNKKQVDDLSKSIVALAVNIGQMTVATRDAQKALKLQNKELEQNKKNQFDAIEISGKQIGKIREDNAAKEAATKAYKEYIKTARELGASETTLNQIRDVAISQNADLKITSEEVVASWSKFKSGKINLSQFIKEADGVKGAAAVLGKSLTGIIGPMAVVTAAIKEFDLLQGERKSYSTLSGYGGGATLPGTSQLVNYLGMKRSAVAMGMSTGDFEKSSISFAQSGLGERPIGVSNATKSAEIFVNDMAMLSANFAAVSTKFPDITDKAFTDIAKMMKHNLGYQSDEVSGLFESIDETLKRSKLTTGEFASIFADIAPSMYKFGTSVNSVASQIANYGNAIKEGIISGKSIQGMYGGIKGESMGSSLGIKSMAKQFGINLPGIDMNSNGNPFSESYHIEQSLAKNPGVMFELFDKIATKRFGITDAAGKLQLARKGGMEQMLPGITGFFANSELNEHNYDEIVGIAQSSPDRANQLLNNLVNKSKKIRSEASGIAGGTKDASQIYEEAKLNMGILGLKAVDFSEKHGVPSAISPLADPRMAIASLADGVARGVVDGFPKSTFNVFINGVKFAGKVVTSVGRNAESKMKSDLDASGVTFK